MCGINGVITFGDARVQASDIAKMNARIQHRGPDDTGVFLDGHVGLGQNRLSIIDLSKAGHQPMQYEHGGKAVVITYNGEVYNFVELKAELEQAGHVFRSKTDTEVLAAAYVEWGVECVKRFNGMFAFVIYDKSSHTVFGARDRFGQKPLKYYKDDTRFIVSSELKAILEHQEVPREVDLEAVDDYLTLQYVPSPRTGFKNIFKLPHAHWFTLDVASGNMNVVRYYDVEFVPEDKTDDQWVDEVRSKLRSAVKRRLVSDVPLGAFLSGGVDSSAVVAMMAKEGIKAKTFSIGFDDPKFDEREYANAVAKMHTTDHKEFVVRPDDMKEWISLLVERYEEPYADSSQLPVYALSKLTREHVTVALTGDAGDENFGGYDKHRRHVFVARWGWLLRLFAVTLPAVQFLRRYVRHALLEKMYILVATINMSPARRHYNYRLAFDEFAKKEFYRPELVERLESRNNIFEHKIATKSLSPVDTVLYLDFETYLPDDLNVKTDLASMTHALEVRSPMLDYTFVDMTARIPWQKKTSVLEGKKILKKAVAGELPPGIATRRKKGFSVPLAEWLRGPLKPMAESTILDPDGLAVKLMSEAALRKLLTSHERVDVSQKIWTLFMLNLWYKEYSVTYNGEHV